MYLLRGNLVGNILQVVWIYSIGVAGNEELDIHDGWTVDSWAAFEKDGISYIPTQYNITTGEIIYQKGMVEPGPEPNPIEQRIQDLEQVQQDTDATALEIDYRLTLLENGVREGETK